MSDKAQPKPGDRGDADDDEPMKTRPSSPSLAAVSVRAPGEELPFEPAGRFLPLGEHGAEKELGRGGLGRVLLTLDAHLRRQVAVKQMLPHLQGQDGSGGGPIAERFLREARITASLEHPGVVPVYELGKRNDGSLYYAMKRVQGRTLSSALAACATLQDRLSLLPHLLDVVQTVAYAHARGVVHRDLKPDNVMIGEFGQTQLLDWGLARAVSSPEVPRSEAVTLRDRPAVLGQRATDAEETGGQPAPRPAQGAEVAEVAAKPPPAGHALEADEAGSRQAPRPPSDEAAGREPAPGQTLRTPPAADSGSHTVAGQALGTPRYMSPEQAHGKLEQMDAQSDVWSLGVMLFELLTGRTPFEGTTAAALILAVASDPVPELLGLEPRAPPALAAVAARALERDRSKRFASAVEMAQALGQAAGVKLSVERRPLGWWAAAAALAVALLGVLGLLVNAHTVADEVARATEGERAGAQAKLARSIAERAQTAWDEGDVFAASSLASEARALADVPLASGVQALVRLSGAPRKAWSMVVPAGCTSLATHAGQVACATLGGVVLFDSQGRESGLLRAGPGWQQAVVALEDGTVVSAGDDKLVRSWSAQTHQPLGTISLASDAVVLAASPDGSTLYAGLRNGEVRRWPRDGRDPVLVTKHDSAVRALAVGDGVFASSARDGVRVFSPSSAPEPSLRLDRPVGALRWTAAGLVVGLERDLFLFNAEATRWSGHLDDVTALAATHTWPLVSGAADGTVRAWSGGRPVARLSGFASPITALAGDPRWPDGPQLYVATRGRTLEAWQWPADGRAPVLPQLGMEPTSAAMAPDGTVVLGFRDARVMRLVGARNALEVAGAEHQGQVKAVAVASHVGLSGGEDGQVFTWGDEGKARLLERREGRRIRALAVTRDGTRAAWSSDDGELVLWSLEFNKEILREQDTPVGALAFSPDGATLALGRQDKQVALIDAASGAPLRRLEGHDAAVRALVFSPDGRTLAAGAGARVTLHEVASGRTTAQLVGARDSVGALAFSPDGALVAAGADDGAVYLWDAASFLPRSELRLHAGDVLAVGFGADGRLLVVGTDRSVRWLVVERPD